MAKEQELSFPQDYLQLENIYLWDSKFERHKEFQPGVHGGHVKVQSRQGFEAEILDAEAADGEAAELFRVKVTQGLRATLMMDGEEPLHTVEATFAVEYRIVHPLPDEKMPDFIEFNCAHNVWPFWREHVFGTMRAASLPVLNVPFFPGKKGKKARRITSASAKQKSLPKSP
ncbi:hypothetical protein [Dyella sp. 2RAB6]|uniref:hypothetical protein n=1 Tax=Dyella sp. 2RAB6 TaxID=3232992 RepID=UPI003F91D1EA